MLGRARWPARAPLLAIIIYLTAGWSVIAALGLAGLTLAVHATALGGGLSHLIGACVLRLRATYATPGGATVAGLGLTLAGAVVARTTVTATDPPARLRAAGIAARANCPAGRNSRAGPGGRAGGACAAGRVLRGRAPPDGGPDHRRGAGAGSRSARRGPRARTSSPGRPPPPPAGLARIARQVLPFLPLMRDADDRGDTAGRTARRRCGQASQRPRAPGHRPGPLATAASPAPALAAAATDTVQRIHRLLDPAQPLGRARRHLLRATAAALALTPVLLALAPAVLALALGRRSRRLIQAAR